MKKLLGTEVPYICTVLQGSAQKIWKPPSLKHTVYTEAFVLTLTYEVVAYWSTYFQKLKNMSFMST